MIAFILLVDQSIHYKRVCLSPNNETDGDKLSVFSFR